MRGGGARSVGAFLLLMLAFSPANAAVLGIDEVRGGVAAAFTNGTSASGDVEVLFSPLRPIAPAYRADLGWIFSPRPMVGLSPTLQGKTSQFYGGLLWTAPLPKGFFLEFSAGGLVHDQTLDRVYADRASPLSTRFLFRESIGIGYQVRNDLRVVAFADHGSNGNLGYRNKGIDRFGVLVGKSFGEPSPPPPAEPAVLPGYAWSGPYVGFGAALTRGHFHFVSPAPSDGSESKDSLNLSGLAGYNFQFASLVAGLEADFSIQGQSGSAYRKPLDSAASSSSLWLGTVRGRAGYVVPMLYAPQPGLLYGTAGIAFSRIAYDTCSHLATQCYDATSGDAIGGWNEVSSIRTGWSAGGGLEVPFGPRMTGKLEYLFVDFGQIDFATANGNETVSFRQHIFRAGMNFNFH